MLKTLARVALFALVAVEVHAGPALLLYPNGGERLAVGQKVRIVWESQDSTSFRNCVVKISPNGGRAWVPVTEDRVISLGDADWGQLEWTVPDTLVSASGKLVPISSVRCLMRVMEYGTSSVYDQSDSIFAISDATSAKEFGILPVRNISEAHEFRVIVQHEKTHLNGCPSVGYDFRGRRIVVGGGASNSPRLFPVPAVIVR